MKAGRGSEQFMVRLPDGMRDKIKAAADANGRSMNAEIVIRLEDSLTTDVGSTVRLHSRDLDDLDSEQANAEFRRRILATAEHLIGLVENEVKYPPRDSSHVLKGKPASGEE